MTKRRIIITLIIALLVIPISVGFAVNRLGEDEPVVLADLIDSHESEVNVGDYLNFKLNLESLKAEDYGEVSYIEVMIYSLDEVEKIEDIPTATLMTKEDINMTVNYATGMYTISGEEAKRLLEVKKKYDFEIYPDLNTEKKTNFRCVVQVIGKSNEEKPTEVTTEVPTETPTETQPGTLETGDQVIRPTGESQIGGDDDSEEEILDSEYFDFLVRPVGGFDDFGDDDDSDDSEYKGSSDYYLRELSVAGYEFTNDFHKTRDTYFVDVEKGVTSLSVNAVPCDSKSRVDIVGNSNVGKDMSKIIVRVRAENKQVKVYRIYVRHSAKKRK